MMLIAPALVLAAPLFGSLNDKPLPRSTEDFYFVAMGDNRPAGAGLPPTATFKELLKEVAIVGPAFVLSSGDLIYGNEETIDQYRQELVWTKPLLDALPCPFYNAAGNHEINNRPEFLAEYTKAFGNPYGAFEFGGYRFLAVCSELPNEKPAVFGTQLAWLKTELGTSKPTIVYEHHPIFKRASNPDAKDDAEVSNSQELHSLYRSGGVRAVFEGHDHVYDSQTHDGISYTIAGGAGAPLDASPTEGGFFHFLIVHASASKLEMTPVPLGSIEVSPLGEGMVAASNYADADLPLTNLTLTSNKEPKSVSAAYSTKKAKAKDVSASILKVSKTADGYVAQVALTLPKHRATVVKLGF